MRLEPILENGSDEEKVSAQWILYATLATSLKLLHPFVPFVTETIWEHVPEGVYKSQELLMVEPWPTK